MPQPRRHRRASQAYFWGCWGSPLRAPCVSRCPGHGLQKAGLPLPPRNEASTGSAASSPQIPCITISLPRSTPCQRSPERGTELLTLSSHLFQSCYHPLLRTPRCVRRQLPGTRSSAKTPPWLPLLSSLAQSYGVKEPGRGSKGKRQKGENPVESRDGEAARRGFIQGTV